MYTTLFNGLATALSCVINFHTFCDSESILAMQFPRVYSSMLSFSICDSPISLMVRGYEPGREDHEFDPRLGSFFLVRCKFVTL